MMARAEILRFNSGAHNQGYFSLYPESDEYYKRGKSTQWGKSSIYSSFGTRKFNKGNKNTML